jgi:hypothetical protein
MSASTLYIPKTEETPEVCFDPEKGLYSIRGRSLPENAFQFYQPILDWVKIFAPHIQSAFVLELELDYFNSSSGRFLYELLSHLESNAKAKNYVTIRWFCEAEDELMLEKGEELSQLLDLQFEIHRTS